MKTVARVMASGPRYLPQNCLFGRLGGTDLVPALLVRSVHDYHQVRSWRNPLQGFPSLLLESLSVYATILLLRIFVSFWRSASNSFHKGRLSSYNNWNRSWTVQSDTFLCAPRCLWFDRLESAFGQTPEHPKRCNTPSGYLAAEIGNSPSAGDQVDPYCVRGPNFQWGRAMRSSTPAVFEIFIRMTVAITSGRR